MGALFEPPVLRPSLREPPAHFERIRFVHEPVTVAWLAPNVARARHGAECVVVASRARAITPGRTSALEFVAKLLLAHFVPPASPLWVRKSREVEFELKSCH